MGSRPYATRGVRGSLFALALGFTTGFAIGFAPGCGPIEKSGTTRTTVDDSGLVVQAPSASPDDLAAQSVCINELMASNDRSMVLEDGTSPDWLELHNPSSVDIDLTGWAVHNESEGSEGRLDALGVLEAGGFALLYADASSAEAPHLPFTLSKEGATIALLRPDGGGDRITYGETFPDRAFYRTTDCCASTEPDCFAAEYAGTPGATNQPD